MAGPIPSHNCGPVYFWREYEDPYGFLSQWYNLPFTTPPSPVSKSKEPMTFLTTEQYMMYHKAMIFNDQHIADMIMIETLPSKQKELGRKVQGFNNKVWDSKKEEVVEEGNWWKFTQSTGEDDDMKQKLLGTGDRLLVEASPHDRIWGVGYAAARAGENQARWGQNLLGKALMRVRDRLRAEEKESDDGAKVEEGGKCDERET